MYKVGGRKKEASGEQRTGKKYKVGSTKKEGKKREANGERRTASGEYGK